MAKRERSFDLESFLAKSKSRVKEGHKKAAENKGGFAEFDDGRYQMRLLKLEIGKSQSSNRPQATMFWKFLDGDYKGQTYRSYRGLKDADGWYYFFLDMKRLGYEIDDPSDVADLIKMIKKDKPAVSASLRTKGEFQNLLINKVLDDEDIEEGDDDEDEDEDKPKKGKGKKSKSKKDDDDEDDDSDDESDDEDSEEEDDDDEDEKPRRRKGKKSKKKDEDEEDEDSEDEEDEDEDSDDEDEEEEKPKRGKKGKGRKKKDEDEEDEDEDDSEEEDEDADEDSEEIAVTVGSIVKAKIKGKTQKAEVVEVLSDDEAVKVETEDGKTVKISADKIISVEEGKKKKRRKK